MQPIVRRLMNIIRTAKQFHTSSCLNIDPRTVEEVRIPVPWGHIAGKWWGNKNNQPIIAIHGWLENAGSFDPFAHALPENFSLLAIDVPGCGFSSHLPPFYSYNIFGIALIIRCIKKSYNFEKLSIIGHSAGSAMCFIYSALFPEDVLSYFGIDYIFHPYKDELNRAENVGELIDKKILLELRYPNKSRSYTPDEAKRRWIAGSNGSLTEKSAEILMKRGVYRIAGGNLLFTRDDRLRELELSQINMAQAYTLAENVKCDVAFINGTKSKWFYACIKLWPELLNIIEKSAKSFTIHTLEGNHHLHMDNPVKIVGLYLDFMEIVKERCY